MITFVLLAAALTVAGVIVVAVPLLRRGATAGAPAPAPWAAIAATGLLVVGSAVLYVSWSNLPWRTVTPGGSPPSMVGRLARQRARRRGDLLLARARFVKLLGMDPPADVRPLIEQQITAIDAKLGGAPPAGGAAVPPPTPATNPGAEVRVNVQLAP